MRLEKISMSGHKTWFNSDEKRKAWANAFGLQEQLSDLKLAGCGLSESTAQ